MSATRVGNVIVQAGLGMGQRGASQPGDPRPGAKRAVVLATYVSDTPQRPDVDVEANPAHTIMCDVLLLRSQLQLYSVPVAPRVWGTHNAEPWVPRGTTATADTNEPIANLNLRSKRGSIIANDLPPAERLNGDHVLVEFLDSRMTSAVIIGPWVHPSTRMRVVEGTGPALGDLASTRGKPRAGERFVRHGGTEFRVSSKGDIVFDTAGANPASPTSDDPTPSDGGEVVYSLKDGLPLSIEVGGNKIATFKRTGTTVDIRLASDTAGQQYIRGNSYADSEGEFVDAIGELVTSINEAITAASGTTSGLIVIDPGALLAFGIARIQFKEARTNYLSTKIRGE